jgi:hypothetical protein
MTGIRRALVLIGLTVAVMVGAAIPASATFAETVSLPNATITALTVAPATRVEAKGTCETVTDPATGAVTSTVHAKVEWQRSTSPGITGYLLTAHLNDGTSYVMARTDASADEVWGSAPQEYLAKKPTFSVTTLTRYGWTALSARSEVLSC